MIFKQLTFTDITPRHQEHEFHWGDNLALKHHLTYLNKQKDDQFIYIWGSQGSGTTHLLQTIADHYSLNNPSIYIPLNMAESITPSCLENLELQSVVSLDDIGFIKHQSQWEEGIFHLYNRIRQTQNTLLVISGDLPPHQIGLKLPDLVSRLQWGLCWQLKEPSDETKMAILMNIANKKGFELPPSVAQYLLSRNERNLSSLMTILEKLDVYSIEAQRRVITIPFLKKCLNLKP
jgi:DnaA family protein